MDFSRTQPLPQTFAFLPLTSSLTQPNPLSILSLSPPTHFSPPTLFLTPTPPPHALPFPQAFFTIVILSVLLIGSTYAINIFRINIRDRKHLGFLQKFIEWQGDNTHLVPEAVTNLDSLRPAAALSSGSARQSPGPDAMAAAGQPSTVRHSSSGGGVAVPRAPAVGPTGAVLVAAGNGAKGGFQALE